jgi:hypothetical protein
MSALKRFSILRLFLAGSLAAVASGCVYGPGPRPAPSGPRSNAPYYYDYYYYPHADVYFQIYTGEYYYRSGGNWRQARALPPNIYLDPGDRRQLRIENDRPYAQDRHRQAQPAAPASRYKPDPARDRQERQNNTRRYDEYRKKYRN